MWKLVLLSMTPKRGYINRRRLLVRLRRERSIIEEHLRCYAIISLKLSLAAVPAVGFYAMGRGYDVIEASAAIDRRTREHFAQREIQDALREQARQQLAVSIASDSTHP